VKTAVIVSIHLLPWGLFAIFLLGAELTSGTHAGIHSARQNSTATSESAADRRRDEIKALEKILPRAADRGAVLFLLAHHYGRLGDQGKALELLKQCAVLEEGFDPETDEAFAALHADPEFRSLIEHVRTQNPPVRQARVAFTIAQTDLFPEGLAVDAGKHVFYMGSEYHNKIVRISETGAVTDFVKEGRYDLMPVGGVHVDASDHSIWCATDPGKKNRSEIVHFDARGNLLERYAPSIAGPYDLNDLVLRGKREIYVTDTEGSRVFRFDRESHGFSKLNLGRPLFEPNGITVSDDGSVLYVGDDLGVIRVDLRTHEANEVSPAEHDTMAGADGLYWYDKGLVAVEYGTGTFRLMRWKLSADGSKVTSSEVLERGTEMVRDPTTGSIWDGKFYFMANTGIENLNDGKIVDRTKLEPLRIAVLLLR